VDNAQSLLETFDYVFDRTLARIDGLSDDEYFWEPTPDCWSLRRGTDGRWVLDGGGGGGPAPNPVPITTICWRICHFGAMALGGFATMRFEAPLNEAATELPATATEVRPFLEANYRAWHDALAGLDEAGWNAPLGASWGEYSDNNTFDLALHILDEVIHHSAEVGLLRDLFSQRSSLQ
jgi:DinB superfamily